MKKREKPDWDLVLKNKGLAIYWANKLKSRYCDLDERIQAGVVGLAEASRRYDTSFGTKFSTYATYWVLQSIRKVNKVPSVKSIGQEYIEQYEGGTHECDINEIKEVLDEIMKLTLTHREESAIRARFQCDSMLEPTLEDIGIIIGTTRERARQLIVNGLEKLRYFAADLVSYNLD